MGSADTEIARSNNEGPQHQVTISQDFYIGEFEVTQKQWKAVMKYNNSTFFGDDQRPVETVTLYEIALMENNLISQLNQLGYGTFSLPTEAQWEYACRAGTATSLNNNTNVTMIDSAEDTNLNSIAWYFANTNPIQLRTYPVGQKESNQWGIYDMHGNVFEWTLDWYAEDYFTVNPITDPTGPVAGTSKVIKGGSFNSPASQCRSAFRFFADPSSGNASVGFRLVLYRNQ